MSSTEIATDPKAPILASISVQVRVALGRLEAKGVAVKIISAPDAWWALAPA